jgi:UDP-N-acetylglucosamine 2-epimerase (non-hydrolysing)
MKTSKIPLIHILAARPNFIKAAPVIKALDEANFYNIIIHTNQHYDYKLSEVFFQELEIPEPNYHLGIKSGSHGYQTGRSLIDIEDILSNISPKGVVVYGDVNSTLAGALAAAKLHIPIFHIESGCRSFDKKMPEEINRLIVDQISELLFCTEESAKNNLLNEAYDPKKIFVVGNTAIDSLQSVINIIKNKPNPYNFRYYLATLHRPFNVDNFFILDEILTKLNNFPHPVIIPTHPRLKNNLKKEYPNLIFIEPLGYLDFLTYMFYSEGILSDSGGVQCEASVLKKPLLTIRPTTEHLLTLNYSNKLVSPEELDFSLFKSIEYDCPLEWDGNASKRIANIIKEYYE